MTNLSLKIKSNLPKIDLAQHIARRFGTISGIQAVTLGGSLARQVSDESSDIDLYIYYNAHNLPSLELLNQMASELDDRHSNNLVAPIATKGLWSKASALIINNQEVDLIYRDINQIMQILTDCCAGQTNSHYTPLYPHAFHDYIYLSELHYAKILHDPNALIENFKKHLAHYPAELKKVLIQKYLEETHLTLEGSIRAAQRSDVLYVSGCLFRSIACLMQVLFARNEQYFINEKRALSMISTFALIPVDFCQIARDVLASPGQDPDQLLASIEKIKQLMQAIKKLC